MRHIRWGEPGSERPGIVAEDGTLLDLADQTPIPAGARLGPPVPRPGKIVCVGLNYADHAEESGQPSPTEPILFLKDPATVVGPNDDVHYPRGGSKVDWEVELGVVIGRRARYLDSEAQALDHVAGYCVSHDVSERAFQLERGGQWVKGKSCETFNPLGPWLVTPDQVTEPQDLALWLDVNGQPAQRGNTRNMIFGVAALIVYISQFMVLEPGDLINTGTPAGVGLGRTPPSYLDIGDLVTLGIQHLGEQSQRLVVAP